MIGVDIRPPNTPPLEMVKVPPAMSSIVSVPALARGTEIANGFFDVREAHSLSALRTTGTTRPFGALTATDTSR